MSLTKQGFAAGMALLVDVYGRGLTAQATDVYRDMFAHVADEIWEGAVREAIRTEDWFPTPSILMAAVVRLSARLAKILTPDEAWQQVMESAREYRERGSYVDRFDDDVWKALETIGGVRAVASVDHGAGIARLERWFLDAYRPKFDRVVDRTARLSPAAEPVGELVIGVEHR